jgi:Uma2 family endonuclease
VVVCDEPEYHDFHRDILLNPTAIFEVLSETTEAFDRGDKFHRYQDWNPSLQDYVLVSQNQPQVELFSRKADKSWFNQRVTGLDATILIPSIGCTLKLADIYMGIVFPEYTPLDL